MKRSIKIIAGLLLSVFAGAVFAQDSNVVEVSSEQEKLDQKKQEQEKQKKAECDQEKEETREIDMTEIFGDPDILNNGESIRSVTEPLPAWKLYCMSWGVWIAVKCEATLAYLKKVQAAMKKRIRALMGLCHAQKKQQR